MPTGHLDQLVKGRLADHDVRYTSGRRRVVGALAAADGPRSAAELYDTLDRVVPLSSLYRSLAVMAEAGVVAPHHGTRGLTRYELAEWLSGHHHHLVCVECGSVEDVELSDEQEAMLRRLVVAVAAATDHEPGGHSLEIDGRCASCA